MRPFFVMHNNTDTIFAPSTAIGGAITVIRISGPDSNAVATQLIHRQLTERMLTYAPVTFSGEVLDESMAVFFRSPNSYTGEDMLELHCHGGLQTFRQISDALTALGLRPAEGGEFTKRAFLNGKMDLTQAEAVMDLINAQADVSLRTALYQLSGKMGDQIASIENSLLDIRSGIEAMIDYPDEMSEQTDDLLSKLTAVSSSIQSLLRRSRQGKYLREGVRAVILGRPNVGKSSVFNALVGENRAIVTGTEGTTRDLIDETIEWKGVSVRLQDTAGIREASDEAEAIGIERAREALQHADILLLIIDVSRPLSQEDLSLIHSTDERRRIIVLNKSDLTPDSESLQICIAAGSSVVRTSCRDNTGFDTLKDEIIAVAEPEHMDITSVTNIRHIRALEQALGCIQNVNVDMDLDCVATELREASHYLGTITGSDVDEQLLDRIFENFCVGK